MSRQEEPPSPLVDAVRAFDEQLRKFTEAAEAARRRPLDSRRNLERALESLKEAAQAEGTLEACARDLLQALNDARDRQQAEALSVQARAREIETRFSAYQALIGRYQHLGADAVALSERAQELMGRRPLPEEGAAPGPVDPEVASGLTELEQRLSQAREGARALREDADASGFEEVAREGHAVEQTLAAVRNKVLLLERALGIVRSDTAA